MYILNFLLDPVYIAMYPYQLQKLKELMMSGPDLPEELLKLSPEEASLLINKLEKEKAERNTPQVWAKCSCKPDSQFRLDLKNKKRSKTKCHCFISLGFGLSSVKD